MELQNSHCYSIKQILLHFNGMISCFILATPKPYTTFSQNRAVNNIQFHPTSLKPKSLTQRHPFFSLYSSSALCTAPDQPPPLLTRNQTKSQYFHPLCTFPQRTTTPQQNTHSTPNKLFPFKTLISSLSQTPVM